MKSKARRAIDKWVKDAEKRAPVYIGEGRVFLFPSGGDWPNAHVVTWVFRQTPKRVFEEFVCDCLGFFNNGNDSCIHIKQLKEEINAEVGEVRYEV